MLHIPQGASFLPVSLSVPIPSPLPVPVPLPFTIPLSFSLSFALPLPLSLSLPLLLLAALRRRRRRALHFVDVRRADWTTTKKKWSQTQSVGVPTVRRYDDVDDDVRLSNVPGEMGEVV